MVTQPTESYIFLKDIFSRINRLPSDIETVLTDSENHFLKLSQNLQTVYVDTESLTSLTEQAVKAITEETDEYSLSKVKHLARISLDEFDSNSNETENSLTNIKNSIRYLDRLYRMSTALKRLARSLNIISINVGVESSRSDGFNNISSFSKEIKTLAALVSETTVDLRDSSESADLIQTATHNEVNKRLKQALNLKTVAHAAVENSLKEIECLIDMSREVFDKTGIHLKNIDSGINKIIEAIQYHDISRQQIEHVRTAIEDIITIFDHSPFSSPKQGEDIAGKTIASLHIQIAQTKQVISELEDIEQKISHAFFEIDTEIHTVVSEISGLNSNSGMNENPFSVLGKNLLKISDLMARDNEIKIFISDSIKSSYELINGLSKYLKRIEDIGVDLHIKAMNAVILSMRLGSDGKALAVLAQEVTRISEESNKFVSEVSDILKAIAVLGEELLAAPGNPGNIDKSIFNEFDLGVEFITGTQDLLSDKSESANKYSFCLKNKISQITSDLSFLDKTKSSLHSCTHEMENIIKNLRDHFTDLDINTSADHDSISVSYTMDIERKIHDQVNDDFNVDLKNAEKNSYGIASDTSPSVTPDNDDGMLGDNIEFF